MLGPRLSSLCNRRRSWITRASRARRYVLSSVIYALQPLPIRKPFEGCMWADVNLTSGQRSDRAQDEARFGFANAVLTIGSQRTTQVKREFNTKVPQVVAREPPPR